MVIVGIDSVVYGVDDMKLATRFLTEWGLKKISDAKTRHVFETVDRDRIVVRPGDAKDLPSAVQPGNTVREVIWGVGAKKDLDGIEKELVKDREVTRTRDGTVHSTDPMGLGIGFCLSRRRVGKGIRRAPINDTVEIERPGKRSRFYDRAAPLQIAHCGFFHPDVNTVEKFYVKRLGFHVSDRYKGKASFMRSSTRNDHHNLLIIKSPHGRTVLDHVAFAVRDIHEVFGGGLAFSRLGWETEIGPGRHPQSSAYFWYFKNPCGGSIEYMADSDVVDVGWKPRTRISTPETFAEWVLPNGILAAAVAKERIASAPVKKIKGRRAGAVAPN